MFSLFRRTPTIKSPIAGFLDLTNGDATTEISADRLALSPLFNSSLDSSSEPPHCNVLFVYCHLEPDGGVRGSGQSLRELIRESGAAVVVVATENSPQSYIAAAKAHSFGRANLVMTIERRGVIFPTFFRQLFAEMKRGVSMPVAWNKLAPQIPGVDHSHCPGTIFACEVGQLAFA
jgi:hypothetical protein